MGVSKFIASVVKLFLGAPPAFVKINAAQLNVLRAATSSAKDAGPQAQQQQSMLPQQAADLDARTFVFALYELLLAYQAGKDWVLGTTTDAGIKLGGEAYNPRPDTVICCHQVAAAHVIHCTEAKDDLKNDKSHCFAAFQADRHIRQLQYTQSQRTKWVSLAVGCNHVELWVHHTSSPERIQRSGLLPLDKPQSGQMSPGLQLVFQIFAASHAQLGFVDVTLPTFQIGGLDVLLHKSMARDASQRVAAGTFRGQAIFAKSAEESKFNCEVAAYTQVAQLQGFPRILGQATLADGARWFVAQPVCDHTLSTWQQEDEASCDVLLEVVRQAATHIGTLADNHLVHGDLSPSNVGYSTLDGAICTTLLDLQTLRRLPQDVSFGIVEITGTPQFMALSLLLAGTRQPMTPVQQTVSTDLESLFYTLLHAATNSTLHWRGGNFGDAAAFDMKLSCMVSRNQFREKVLSRISSPQLQAVALKLRAAFYPDDFPGPDVSVAAFQQCLQADL
ncbi:hypothetical protein WJX73_005532 [Symbiochloris irregularis]|uniref:Fungal-type protein kinase domain-containing protein n=1 Tax=Symbiochloris irregularis TaxID=706552 RepID=A0AAW1NMF8_9CHLO